MNKWPSTVLADVADIERSSVQASDIQSGTLYVGLENIVSGGDFLDVREVTAGELASSKFRFTASHLLYGKLRPYLAKIARPSFSGVCSTDILPVLPGKKLCRDYLSHYLRQQEVVDFANSRASGANLPRLSPAVLASFEIPLPPLAEQRRIAAILDQAEALRAQRRAAIAQLDSLGQAVFLEMFGDPALNPFHWPKKSLGSVSSKFSDGPFGSNLKSAHYVATGVRVVRLQNIGVGKFVDDDQAYVSEEHFASLRKHECLPGDVLIATLGSPNLRACIHPEWLSVALNKADCIQCRPAEGLATADYICALLNNPATEQLAQTLMHGQTRVRISMGQLRQLQVPVPPMALQQKFSGRSIEIAKLKLSMLNSAQRSDDLFASLQHRAFRGEL